MTPAEAVTRAESMFTVHADVGLADGWTDQNGKVLNLTSRDMECAPNGEPYEVLTSYGLGAQLPRHALVMFQNEGLGVQWWLDEVEAWAADLRKDRDTWKKINLYWRDKPVFIGTTYIAMDQGGLARTASPLAAIPQIDLGFVWSRMLLSVIGPNGEDT